MSDTKINVKEFLKTLNIKEVNTKEEAEFLMKNTDVDCVIFNETIPIDPINIVKHIGHNYAVGFPLTRTYPIIENMQFNSSRKATHHYVAYGYKIPATDTNMFVLAAMEYCTATVEVTFLEEPQVGDTFSFSFRNYMLKQEHIDFLRNNVLLTDNVIYSHGACASLYIR